MYLTTFDEGGQVDHTKLAQLPIGGMDVTGMSVRRINKYRDKFSIVLFITPQARRPLPFRHGDEWYVLFWGLGTGRPLSPICLSGFRYIC